METRRQYRSCDQCRKGKRACDGNVPELLRELSPAYAESNTSPRSRCSNCTKWRKVCTYNWLSAISSEPRKKKPRHDTASPEGYEYVAGLSSTSNDLSDRFERSALINNMFRIYHDSMENALSCWLAEQNCPYSVVAAGNGASHDSLGRPVEKEQCTNWSNRIFSRVLRLDHAFGTSKGQQLTAVEDKKVSRALLSAIMAFASQWATQPSQRAGTPTARVLLLSPQLTGSYIADFDTSQPSPSEHFSRVHLWNQAHRALDASAGISSFRVIFANIVFSLTQRPLDIREHISSLDSMTNRSDNQMNGGPDDAGLSKVDELHDLLDNDYAPQFMENAARQLFTFRYKLTHLQRKTSNPALRMENIHASSDTSQSPLSSEDNETFNLLFWLGIMFDTLSAAMHERPPVVSDEDSEISCTLPLSKKAGQKGSEDNVSLLTTKNFGLWGDLFLLNGTANKESDIPRWPCTYAEAEKTLCDASPVKVLLFRRVSRIQTLVYRGSGPERLEEAIRDALHVYHHWNSTYKRFMLDCSMNHDSLPPRIQSWYVILAGHWHLAAMILADTLESLDRAEIGLDSQRESRRAIDLGVTLRTENAIAVSNLAYRSLCGQGLSFAKSREFHDSVNERAMLTEPWTAVLTHSFTKAGYNLLDMSHAVHLAQNEPSSQALLQCGYCIDGLLCLGRKSDVALLSAKILSSRVDKTLQERVGQSYSVPGCHR